MNHPLRRWKRSQTTLWPTEGIASSPAPIGKGTCDISVSGYGTCPINCFEPDVKCGQRLHFDPDHLDDSKTTTKKKKKKTKTPDGCSNDHVMATM